MKTHVEGEAVVEPCDHTFRGGIQCDLLKGHGGPHRESGVSPMIKHPLAAYDSSAKSYGYDEGEVLAYTNDIWGVFQQVGLIPNKLSAVWVSRMQFDAMTMGYGQARLKHLSALRVTLLGSPDQPQPQPQPQPPSHILPINNSLNPYEQFMEWVKGKPFDQQTLLDLRPTFAAYSWELSPPNANGEYTKIRPAGMTRWVRVGFGEGNWVWKVQLDRT